MNKKILSLLILIPLTLSFIVTMTPYISEKKVFHGNNSPENSLPLINNPSTGPIIKELIYSQSFNMNDISSHITFNLYRTNSELSMTINGNGNAIYIKNEYSYQKLFMQINNIVSDSTNLKFLAIENAPGTILENFNYGLVQPSNLVKNLKLNLIEENKTINSILAIYHSDNSIVRNVTFTGFSSSTPGFIQVIGSQKVNIYNNTFTGMTINTVGFKAIDVFNDGASFLSSGTKIYNNTFYSITSNVSCNLISLRGLPATTLNDIYISNNNISLISTNHDLLVIFNITYGNNITLYQNYINNINTKGSFDGILISYSNIMNISTNQLNLIYTQDEIIGIKGISSSGMTLFNNSMVVLASTNNNVTGLLLDSCNGFNLINNTISQLIASYDSFDFSDSKIVKGLDVKTTTSSNIVNNSFTQLSSKSKAFALILENFISSNVDNNSITGINSKSSSAIIIGGVSNTNSRVTFNVIKNIVSTATDTIGMSINNANAIKIQNNTLFDLESYANLHGISVYNSLSANILNNSLSFLSTNSPVYDLYGIRISNSNNSNILRNLINRLYSQLTFVGAIAVENSQTISIAYNNITNCNSDFSSTFGILLENNQVVSLNNNYIHNMTTANTSPMSLANNKISKTSVSVELAGGFGVFISLSNNITLNSNLIGLTNFWLNADESVTFITFSNNVVDGTPLTFVSMTHPADKIFEQGTLATNITWTAQDPSAYLYTIYVDSILVSDGFWYNNVPIVFGVSDINTLTLGQHQIQLVLTDDKGHKINDIVNVNVVEYTAPIFTASLTDVSILNGSLGNSLSWKAYDLNPGSYYIYRNSSFVTSATWTSNFPISVNIDGLSVGTYNFTIVVKDSSLNQVVGSRFVYVLTNGSMLFNLKPNSAILSSYGSKNTTLNWIISSVQGGEYVVTVDNDTYPGSWSPNVPINFTLQNLALGEHTIKFTASNSFTQVSQEILVTVIIPQTSTTNTTTLVPSFSYATSSFNLLNVIKIDTTNILFLIILITLIGGTLGFLYYNRYRQYQSRNYINKSERIEQLIEVGKAYIKMGNNLEAIKVFKRALRGAIAIDDVRLKAQIQVNLGYVGLQLKDESSIDSSLTHLNEALEVSLTIKDKTIQVLCYSYLGDLYSLKGDSGESIKNYNKGISLAVELDDEALGIQILEKLGLYYHHLGQYPNAIRSFDQGLILANTIKDSKSEMNFNFYKGNSLLQQNQNSEAISFYNNALKISKRINDITSQAKITGEIGRAYYQMGKNESKALNSYNESIELAKQVGDERVVAYQNRNLAILLFEQNKFDEALEKIDLSLDFERNPQFLNIKADSLIGKKEISTAIKYYNKALISAKKNNELKLESEILQKLTMIETKLLHEETAKKYKAELDQILPDIGEWEQKLSSRISKLKIISSTKVEELVFTLIGENVEADPKEIKKIQRESERLEKINLKEASKDEVDQKNTGGKKNE